MKRYAPEPADGDRESSRKADESDDAKPGATLVVRELSTGRDTTFGNVSEYAWQSAGDLLAMTISAEGKAGNGVQLFDPASGALRVLDSAAAAFTGLTWRKDADDLAVLRSKTDPGRDGPTQLVLAWTGLQGGAGAVAQLRSDRAIQPRSWSPHPGRATAIMVGRRQAHLRRDRRLGGEGAAGRRRARGCGR